MQLDNVLVVFHNDRINLDALSAVKSSLDKRGIRHSVLDRTRLTRMVCCNRDLMVTVGGDGTFLKTSHFNVDVPMLGVNSNPQAKEGFLIRSDAESFDRHIGRIIEGKYKITPLLRLACRINSRAIRQLATNDIYFGRKKGYLLTNYELTLNGKAEYQRGSGVIVSTPIGSNAWAKSAGGKVLNYKDSDEKEMFEYIVREPYVGALNRQPTLAKGILTSETLKIRFLSIDGIIVLDSVGKEYPLKKDDVVEISKSDNYLKLIEF